MNELVEAYAACEALAKSHYENFPVASTLMPAHLRPHVAAVYAFARTADDFADEPGPEPARRLDLLKQWRRRLHSPSRMRASAEQAHAADEFIFVALHDTIDRFKLPVQLFDDLLDAFTQDVTTTRYSTWAQVIDYCRRSANPVGRLVLRLSGYDSDALDRASDAVCTALQLTNFWQDLAIDWRRGRLYVPAEEHVAAGASLESLDRGEWTNAWAVTLARCAQRTRALFGRGRPVADGVRGRLRWELRATWLGGMRVLDRLERSGYDVFRERPTLGAGDVPSIAWRALWWRR